MKNFMNNNDFTLTHYPTIEEKLGRKLSKEENEKFCYTSGMYKEYFYNNLKQCTSSFEAEELLKGNLPFRIHQPPSLWKQIINWICNGSK